MIYHPKVKRQGVAFVPDASFGDIGISASDLLPLTENSLRSPSAVLEALAQTKLSWVTSVSTGSRTIKYSNPPDDVYREIRAIQTRIKLRKESEVAAWRRRKNAAMQAIRKSLTERVPVYKYRREWRVKDVTYTKKLRLPYALGVKVHNSGTAFRFGTPEFEQLIHAADKLGAFDKAYIVRITVQKTFGYWANVRYVSRYRKCIKNRKELHDRVADWVTKNPPYRASKDSSLAADRQRLHNLRLKRAGQYNQCVACVDISAVGRMAGFNSAVLTLLSQYLVDPSLVLPPGAGIIRYRSDFKNQTFLGFVVKDEWWRPPYQEGDKVVEGQWITDADFLPAWESIQVGHNHKLNYELDNTAYARYLLGYESHTVHHMIDGRVWPVVPGRSTFEVANATDHAVLNVQAGGANPFEWNFARSALELKDSSQTYKYAKDFLRQVAGGKFKSLLTVKAAASAYLTYKFGIEPTASDLGQLLGTSRALLKHTYPTLRTLAALAEGATQVAITGRSAISFGKTDYRDMFASKLDVAYEFDELHVHTIFSAGEEQNGSVHVLSSQVPFAQCPSRASLRGNRTYISTQQWELLESRNCAPKWVWVPERGVAFQRYSADKVRSALGTSFSDVLLSLDSLTTGWELIPLSFVVDWFTNVRSSIKAMDNLIHANKLGLSPDGEGAWYSMRYRLMLACPIYRKGGENNGNAFVHFNYALSQTEIGDGSGKHRFTVLSPKQGSIRIERDLVGVNLQETNIKAYARNLLDDAPLTALMPKLEVSLNAGKLSSLLAMLLS